MSTRPDPARRTRYIKVLEAIVRDYPPGSELRAIAGEYLGSVYAAGDFRDIDLLALRRRDTPNTYEREIVRRAQASGECE